MAHTLSDMIQDAMTAMGRVGYRNIFATGGSTTTLIDTKLNLSTQPDYSDDDDTLVRGTVIVSRTTDGAAPQGEYQRISAYNETTATITVDTAFSAAIGAGDRCMVVHSQFKLEELIELANQALTDIGDIVLVDTSITTAASQTEYTLPVALKDSRPIRVQLQGVTTDANDNEWQEVTDFYITPATPGSTGLITFARQFPAGRTLKIWYMGKHPTVNDFDDDISDTIHPNLAKWAMVTQLWRWQNPSDGVQLNQFNEALRNYEVAKVSHPVWKPPRRPQWFVSGRTGKETFTTPDPA